MNNGITKWVNWTTSKQIYEQANEQLNEQKKERKIE